MSGTSSLLVLAALGMAMPAFVCADGIASADQLPIPKGIVLDAGNVPLPGVTVRLVLSGDSAVNNTTWVNNGTIVRSIRDNDSKRTASQEVKTDADGAFAFEHPKRGYFLLLTHDAGWKDVTPEELLDAPEIRLTPWNGLKGTLSLAGKPASGRKFRFTQYQYFDQFGNRTAKRSWNTVYHTLEGTAADDATIALDRVVPGVYTRGEIVALNSSGFPDSIKIADGTSPLDLARPGTTTVDLGSTLQPVKVRFTLEGQAVDWSKLEVHAFPAGAFMERAEFEMCGMPFVESDGYLRFFKSPDSAPYRVGHKGANADGSLELGPLPAEEWVLHAYIRTGIKDANGEAALGIERRFRINHTYLRGELPPVDLGELRLKPVRIGTQLRNFLDSWVPAK